MPGRPRAQLDLGKLPGALESSSTLVRFSALASCAEDTSGPNSGTHLMVPLALPFSSLGLVTYALPLLRYDVR